MFFFFFLIWLLLLFFCFFCFFLIDMMFYIGISGLSCHSNEIVYIRSFFFVLPLYFKHKNCYSISRYACNRHSIIVTIFCSTLEFKNCPIIFGHDIVNITVFPSNNSATAIVWSRRSKIRKLSNFFNLACTDCLNQITSKWS